MYINSVNDLQKGENVAVVGKIARVEGAVVYITINNQEIPVKSKNISSYVSGAVVVTGFVDAQGYIIEEKVECIDEDFDTKFYSDFVDVSKKVKELF